MPKSQISKLTIEWLDAFHRLRRFPGQPQARKAEQEAWVRLADAREAER